MAWPAGVSRKEYDEKRKAAVQPDREDHSCLVYRDKAGVKLGGGPSEGSSYMGAIAEEARKGTPEQVTAE